MSTERDLVMPELGAATLVRYTLGKSVRRMLHHEAGLRSGRDPEDLHQFRVATRRLRSDLHAFRAVLDRGWADSLRTDLRWLGDVVGAVRDNDVLAERLLVQVESLGPRDAEPSALLLARLAAEGADARAAMLDALGSERYDMVTETLVRAVREPVFAANAGETDDGSAARLVTGTVWHQWQRLRDALAALPDPPADADLHRIRTLAKRLRSATEAGVPLFGPNAARFADAVIDIQTVLGDQHDAVVAEEWLRAAAAEKPALGVVVGQLVARNRREAARCRQAALAAAVAAYVDAETARLVVNMADPAVCRGKPEAVTAAIALGAGGAGTARPSGRRPSRACCPGAQPDAGSAR